MNGQSKGWHCFNDLNDFLVDIRQDGDLIEINETMSPRFEIGAVLRELGEQEGHAALFTDVDGFPGHVIVGNLLGHRRRIARVLGVHAHEILLTYVKRKNQRIPPVDVDRAPVKQVTYPIGDLDLVKILPALTHHERDASPYLTCAVTFGKDPETGRQSMGLHRIQIQGIQTLSIHLATPPLSRFLEKAWKMNRPFEVAVVVGPDPATLIASVTRVLTADDKIEIAGGFRGKAVEMVRCETVDLKVPAHAQYIIEGVMAPGHLGHEGIFGDSTGTYLEAESPVMKVTSVSHRKKPIYQALQPWSSEDDALLNLCFGSDLLEDVRKDYPFVHDLHMISGTLFGHIVASVEECSRPWRRSAIVALLTRNPFVKRVIVVDKDIDIRNYREVEWAMATRFQPDRDLILLPDVQGSMIDPSAAGDGASCKMGMDATFSKVRRGLFEKITVPEETKERARDILEKTIKNIQQGKGKRRQ